MQIHTREKCLKETRRFVSKLGFHPESNKSQELIRLIYEICLRDDIPASGVIPRKLIKDSAQPTKELFTNLKLYLVKKRYPRFWESASLEDIYLPRADFNYRNSVVNKGKKFSPKRIFVEKNALNFPLTKLILSKFKKVPLTTISSLKQYLKSYRKFSIRDYNQRQDSLFLVKENFDFVKLCPCTKGCVCCGYIVLNLGFGCIYDCSYCFLQGYTNARGIMIPVNIDDYLQRLEQFIKGKKVSLRIGTGEFTDSLALDHITGFSKILIPFFAKFDNVLFELKTKSCNIDGLLKLNHNNKAVISWSLNPQSVVESDEWGTTSLGERLKAAKKCVDRGYYVGFHFDPIVYSKGWEREYRDVIESIFAKIHKDKIAWISLGTFRFPTSLKTVIEQRFPKSKILNEELILGFDRKIRYPQELRINIYRKMFGWIRRFDKGVCLYLCMESPIVWQAVFNKKPNAQQLFARRLV